MNYKLIGQRNLRKYTAAKTSPTYAAAIDAQLIVDSLCDVPWTKVSDKSATMTYHTEENVGTKDKPVSGLDMNVVIRDQFDAALFCAGHSGGQHLAHANAAVYHYVLPDGTLPRLTRLVANVTSDPYNSAGARIAILTNATGEIPTNCNTCRTGDAHADGVAPRSVANGNWFPTMSDCVFSATPGEGETALPSGGLQLQKHLFLFVLMESYSTVRGNWLEGCSYIKNLISITTDAAVPGWTDGDTIDLTLTAAPNHVLKIVKDGVLPYIPGAAPVGEVHVAVRTDANPVIEDDGSQNPIRPATGDKAAAAVGRLFSMLYSGTGDIPSKPVSSAALGAAFNITRATEPHVTSDSDRPADTEVLRIDSAALVVPFVFPCDFTPARLSLSFDELSLTPGARFNVFLADGYLTSLTENQLKNPGLYDGQGAPLTLLGTIDSGTTASFDLPASTARVGTIVITGFFPPDRFDLVTGGRQGTGPTVFLPDISITD